MKSQVDPRHLRRRRLVQRLFALSFSSDQERAIIDPSLREDVIKIFKARKRIDPIISKSAPEWPLSKLNRIDLAILRLAVFELLVAKEQPIKVIIDEAVELAKELGGESSPGFVNGVLGTIVKEQNGEKN